jgi:hypothetical protein
MGWGHPQNRSLRRGPEVLTAIFGNRSAHIDGHSAITRAQDAVLGFCAGDDLRLRGSSMDDKWRVSRVELLEGGLLFGFVLYDQKGRPCVSFGYSNRAKANLGRNHVAAALKDAEQILGR